MKKLTVLITSPTLLALTACSDSEQVSSQQQAEEFAARINGGTQANQGDAQPSVAPPTVAPPREAGSPVATAPQPVPVSTVVACNADKMGPFIGKPADDAIRTAVLTAAAGAAEVRFIQAESQHIDANPANPRLNVMVDSENIIRDARCG